MLLPSVVVNGGKPGGTGSSSRDIGFPCACNLMASSNCLQILPYLRALEELPSVSAATFVLLYTSRRSLSAPSMFSRPCFGSTESAFQEDKRINVSTSCQ